MKDPRIGHVIAVAGLSALLLACRSDAVTPSASATQPPIARPGGGDAAATDRAPSVASLPPRPTRRVFSFDAEAVGAAPFGFVFARTGAGNVGRWVVRDELGATGRALVQVDADPTDNRFPIGIAAEPLLEDVRVSVRCMPISGAVDRACGLVLRYEDENNYWLARANALEANVRLYFVKDGRRTQVASASALVTTGAWHTLVVDARGEHYEVGWDGQPILAHDDATFRRPGRVGVWTKADSVTAFDDLTVEAR